MYLHEYILEVTKIKSIPILIIDDIDQQFLWYILRGQTSAYKIFSILKIRSPMAYKNVHSRIKNLFNLNLIEEIKTEGGFKHGAINYKLTTRGLVCHFSEIGSPHEGNIFLSYSENTLFKTFLYPYFERNTIKSATYSLSRLIASYLEQCCQMTRYALEMLVYYIDPDIKSTEVVELPPIIVLQFQLNWHIKSFLLKTAIMTEDVIDWRYFGQQVSARYSQSKGSIRCTANDRVETFTLLSGDKKFMKALEEIEEQFSEGYNKLIELKNKKKK